MKGRACLITPMSLMPMPMSLIMPRSPVQAQAGLGRTLGQSSPQTRPPTESARRLNITASESGAGASSQRPRTGGEEGNCHSVDVRAGGGGGGERGMDEHQTIPEDVTEGNVLPFLPTICLSRRVATSSEWQIVSF